MCRPQIDAPPGLNGSPVLSRVGRLSQLTQGMIQNGVGKVEVSIASYERRPRNTSWGVGATPSDPTALQESARCHSFRFFEPLLSGTSVGPAPLSPCGFFLLAGGA